jgi:LDH2 family malate/lactate/ureidoglycolate dehydrogenase
VNTPPDEFIRVPHEALRSFACTCLQAAGLNAADARQLAGLLVDSDLRGVRSHGTRSLLGYARAVQQRQVNPDPQITVLAETETSIHIDGDGSLGYAPTMLATQKCIEKAKHMGTAVGAIQCIGHYGSAGHYVRRAMAEGLIGFSVQSASPQYYTSNEGRRAAHYGNPPLCFGLPSENEPPVVLDVATCILADYQRGEEFEALEEKIPAAFFKSMGYAAVGTALGGAFVGQASQRASDIARTYPAARLGGMIWLVDASLFVPGESFRQAVDDMVRLAREQLIPLRGYTESTLPGAVEHRLEREYRSVGIRMDQMARERLAEAGAEYGIDIPW